MRRGDKAIDISTMKRLKVYTMKRCFRVDHKV